jgi:ABC-type maltose transport system permease subunit
MKLFTIILTVTAVVLIGYNITKINFDSPFEGQSIVALITIFAALCAIALLQILRLSKKVDQKLKRHN